MKSGPAAQITPKGKDWAWAGGPTTFYVLNESPEAGTTVATVSCVWGPVGGQGPGPTPPDIPGLAVGTAELKIAHIKWDIAPKVQLPDGESEINWAIELVNDNNNQVDVPVAFTLSAVNVSPAADWTIEPESGAGPELDGTVVSADPSRGNLRVDYTYFGAEKNSTSEEIKFAEVQSIQPDSMSNLQEIDDGDENPKTRVFIVPIAPATEFPLVPVTVRAYLNPNLVENEVPAGWTLQGGNGNEKLTRTVNRSVAAGASKTEFTFSYNGTDSEFKTTIYVYDAKVGLYADKGDMQNIQVGHSWGRYTVDDDTRLDLIDSDYWDYLKEIGFWPSIEHGIDCAGAVRLGSDAVGAHWPTGWKEYPVLFYTFQSALSTVNTSYYNPPWYNLFNCNCTDYAIWLGEIVGIYTMDPSGVSTPWEFSSWLNSN